MNPGGPSTEINGLSMALHGVSCRRLGPAPSSRPRIRPEAPVSPTGPTHDMARRGDAVGY